MDVAVMAAKLENVVTVVAVMDVVAIQKTVAKIIQKK
jgi:energy-converting hydrogenase Eha subunit C